MDQFRGHPVETTGMQGNGQMQGQQQLLNVRRALLRSRLNGAEDQSNPQQYPRLNQLRAALLQSPGAGQNNRQQRFDQFLNGQIENANEKQTEKEITPLVFFPSTPFTTPIQSVNTPGFRIFSFSGLVSTLLSSNEPSTWLSARTTVSDASLLDDLLLNFIYLTHKDCPVVETHKAAALMYIMLYKPNGNPLLGTGEGWHRDPSPWQEDGHVPTRYAITLLGTSTRMLDPEAGPAPQLGRVMPRAFARERGVELGQVIRFTMGRIDSPLHAVPAITQDRVFMNIVYGSEAEVRSNRKKIPWKG
jgi:hypothetical protein